MDAATVAEIVKGVVLLAAVALSGLVTYAVLKVGD